MRIKLRFYQLLINWDAKSGPVGCWKLKKKKRELLELEQDDKKTLFLFLFYGEQRNQIEAWNWKMKWSV